MSLYDLVGVAGLVLLLGAFVTTGGLNLRPPAALLSGANCLGASMLAVYAVANGQLIFVALESCWALAAGISLARQAPIQGASRANGRNRNQD